MPLPEAGQKWDLLAAIERLNVFETLMGAYTAGPNVPSTPTMSVHLYRLAAQQPDNQGPHSQEELYYVMSGKRTLVLHRGTPIEKRIDLKEGELVYVPANVRHQFDGGDEFITLVFFAPTFTG
jgi:mannose-6-phosphate isomerase-like protein (cupin superfamily)